MKNYLKKIGAILLVFSMLFVYACSCGDKNPDSPSNPDSGLKQAISVDNTTNHLCTIGDKIADVVADGSSQYLIIYAAENDGTTLYAAQELKYYINEISHVSVSIREDDGTNVFDGNKKIISLGNTSYFRTSGMSLDTDKLGLDGFYLVTKGKSLFVVAKTGRGVIYGTHDWLERTCNLKFLTAQVTYYDQMTTIPLMKTYIMEIPDFNNRMYVSGDVWYNSKHISNSRFAAPLEPLDVPANMGGSMGWMRRGSNNPEHNSLMFVDPVVYGKEHPEFFVSGDNTVTNELNYTNGITMDGKIDETMDISVIKIAIANMKKFILESSEETVYFNLSIQDHPYAKSQYENAEMIEKYTRMGVMIRFMNLISDEVAKWQQETPEVAKREIKFVTFAYSYNSAPPLVEDENGELVPIDQTVIPRDNVYIRLCPSMVTAGAAVSLFRTLDRWTKLHDKFMVYTYSTMFNNYFEFVPAMSYYGEFFRSCFQANVDSVYVLSAYHNKNMWRQSIESYVLSKLLWNVNLSVDELSNEFIRYYFGEISESSVKTVWNNYMRKVNMLYSEGKIQSEGTPGTDNTTATQYSLTFLQSQVAEIERAIAHIENSDLDTEDKNSYKLRLESVLLTPWQCMIKNASDYGIVGGQLRELSNKFFSTCDVLGIERYGEHQWLSAFRAQFES